MTPTPVLRDGLPVWVAWPTECPEEGAVEVLATTATAARRLARRALGMDAGEIVVRRAPAEGILALRPCLTYRGGDER